MLLDRFEDQPVRTYKRPKQTNVSGSTVAQLILLQNKFESYIARLNRQSLSPHTIRAYKVRLQHFLGFLGERLAKYPCALTDEQASNNLVQDYRHHLKANLKSTPQTINAYLTAIDSFYQYLGLGKVSISREELPQLPPPMLTQSERTHFLHCAQRFANPRDRAIAYFILATGIRISECAALNIDDLSFHSNNASVKVRGQKNNACRQISIPLQCGQALDDWLDERKRRYPQTSNQALWISLRGNRLSVDSIDHLIRKLAILAKLQAVSTMTLRNTCLTNLLSDNQDITTIANLAGHKKLETTRRYQIRNTTTVPPTRKCR